MLRAVFVLWLMLDLLLGLLIVFYGRPGPVDRADVIIVLGSGLNRDGSAGPGLTRRAVQAATLWTAGSAPWVLCAGGHSPGFPQSEAAACRQVLVANGVPENVVHLEAESRSTEENAIFSHRVMQAQGWRTSLLVTDPYHMLRASLIFGAHGVSHRRAPVPGHTIATGWYVNRAAREVIALQWQAVKALWFGDPPRRAIAPRAGRAQAEEPDAQEMRRGHMEER